MENKTQKLKELFLKNGNSESESIELDNLDKARLVKKGKKVVVKNEHGTTFPITDLSNQEVEIFLNILQ